MGCVRLSGGRKRADRAGDPVMATLWFEGDTTLARTCSAFLRRAQDTGDYLAPIDGTLELAR
jgi:hypothetical protein